MIFALCKTRIIAHNCIGASQPEQRGIMNRTGKKSDGSTYDAMKYDMTTPIHLKAPAGMVIVLANDAYGSSLKEKKTGLNEIKNVHDYLLSLSDVGGLYYMSKGGSIWDHWKNHFLAWAV